MLPARTAGFSLIETMVVVGILSAVVITIPLISRWLNRQGVRHAVQQLQSDLQLSRVTAIRQRQTCVVRFNTPALNQYFIDSVNRRCDLSRYSGKVHFLKQGPDGKPMASKVSFNGKGMSTTVVPADIFITDGGGSTIYRIQIKLPGGISVRLWQCDGWQ